MVSSTTTVIVVVAVALLQGVQVSAQVRPSYHPRPGGFSQVLPQYANNQSGEGADTDVGNRDNAPQPPPAPGNTLEDTQLANRVQEWPRPHQPFWYLNQQHIAQHTAQRVPCQGANCPPVPQATRGSFSGGRSS